MPLWKYLEDGGKRAVAVFHRRAGKDSLSLNFTATQAFERVGVYWHMLPTAKQGRKVVWDAIDREGRRVIDQAFPEEVRTSTHQQEMRIELLGGSIWQVVGSDNYDSLVGSNPVGVVFSEYSVANPAAWDFIRPILAENGGWAIFIYTPRGKNHGFDLYKMAKDNPNWYCQVLSVEDSKAISLDIIEEERAAGMTDSMIEQEFYCSFEAAVVGAYYGQLIRDLELDDKVTDVPYDPVLPVGTAWDLGIDDSTAIWFFQVIGKSIHIFDYYANSGAGLEHYVKYLDKKPYRYNQHIFPHDMKAREMGTGKSRVETVEAMGLKNCEVLARLDIEDGIQAVRNLLPKCYFDKVKTQRGIEALSLYRAEYDERHKVFKPRPVHDWTSHAADAFRALAMGLRDSRDDVNPRPVAQMDYDPFDHGDSFRSNQGYVEQYDPFK